MPDLNGCVISVPRLNLLRRPKEQAGREWNHSNNQHGQLEDNRLIWQKEEGFYSFLTVFRSHKLLRERVHEGLGHSTHLTRSFSSVPAFTLLLFVAKVALCLAEAENQLCFCFSIHSATTSVNFGRL